MMSPQEFIANWQNNDLSERAGAQAHFFDLCDLLGVEKPRDPENYCFERGAQKSGGGGGWADVWKRGFFGWENKKPGRDLKAALKQLTDYALALENPPLLVVCDREVIEIHTAFSGYPDEPRTIRITDLIDEDKRQLLRWVFTDPIKLRPEKSTAAITLEMAGEFADLADRMRGRGLPRQQVAHFLMQCLFCMFAEDEAVLPGKIFSGLLHQCQIEPEKASERLAKLFNAMNEKGGIDYGFTPIPWFNGGLFSTIDVPQLTVDDIVALIAAAYRDWRAIDPSIFGTLFERGLLSNDRAKLGAHYTDTATIEKLIAPVVREPLMREWEETKKQMEAALQRKKNGKKDAEQHYQRFLLRLEEFRVLDPACGSGNFLYLSLRALREVEKRARLEAENLGLPAGLNMHTGPHNILGIEINEFAAELARVTVWIGDIQWSRQNGYPYPQNPILKPLDGIEQRDAILRTEDGGQITEATWPVCDVIVGNPPFLGGSKKRGALGDDYFDSLNTVYPQVPGGADLVCYWFHKANKHIKECKVKAAGLVATNSIRGGANRSVLDAIVADTRIFEAWSDEPWVNDGAAVRVSLVCFGDVSQDITLLDGDAVATIFADLTADVGLDLSTAKPLSENMNCCFMGSSKKGSFDINGTLARSWLSLPNPNGKPNAEVIKPVWNAMDVVRRNRDFWIIDFGTTMSEKIASLYEKPFEYSYQHVKPEREKNNRESYRKFWWRHAEARPSMRTALDGLSRYIVTPAVSKHRIFVWCDTKILPDQALLATARSDDITFGILSSRFHELWSLRMGTSLEDRPRYTPTTCFETFPFPLGLTPRDTITDASASAIAGAAKELNEMRESWLNPPQWVDWVRTPEEEAAGFPLRPVAKPGHEADLKKRTLTNLYNERPAWLKMAHESLDKAVALAYGWNDYTPEMSDAEILKRLLALNLQRSS